jgi:hypothetical protein
LIAAADMVNEHFLIPPRMGACHRSGMPTSGHLCLYKDYFDQINLLYKEKAFRRRYRKSRELFSVILNGAREYDDYFETKYDCTNKIGFSSYQKMFRGHLAACIWSAKVISLTTTCT